MIAIMRIASRRRFRQFRLLASRLAVPGRWHLAWSRPDQRGIGRRRAGRRGVAAIAIIAVMTLLASCTSVVAGMPYRIGGPPTSGDESLAGTPAPSDAGTPSDGEPTHRITEPPSAGGSASGNSESPGQKPGLAQYYTQTLSWGDCASYATTSSDRAAYGLSMVQCARMTVPMDYAHPDGKTITIGVLRQQATGDKIGSVIFNPGGPGASGMSIVATLAQYRVDPTLADRFDFIGFDPRGVGSSEPQIVCQTDKQRDQDRADNWPGFMPSSTPAQVDAANERSKALVGDCLAGISSQGVDAKAFLAQVGTTTVAKDLDVLRAALGDDQLTYVGWSYGTSIGTQYAEQFPDKVRAMILDGAVDPAVDSATDSRQQTTAFQQAFDDFTAWCASRDGCPWQSADVANSRFQALSQPLMDTPMSLPDGRELSFLDAVIGVANALYSDSARPSLLTALDDLAHGRGAALMALADEYHDRDSSGHYSNMLEAFTAIRCMDSNRITDPRAVLQLNQKLIAASPFQDSGQPAAAIFDTCAYWPVPPTMLPHTPDPKGLAPVLVVSTIGDPATPYQSGVNLAKDLDGRLLTVKGTRHTGYMLSGLGCVNKAGDDYLINLAVPDEGTTCSG